MDTSNLKLLGISGIAIAIIVWVAVVFYVWKSVLEMRNLMLSNKLMKKDLAA